MFRCFLMLFITMLASCNQKHQTESQQTVTASPVISQPLVQQKDSFSTGTLIDSVSLRLDASQSYALYLPKGYSQALKYPVIIFFDPHGDGSLPLNLYKELADKFNFVLVGSNNSKNGITLSMLNILGDNLVADVKARLSVDESKLALCGFSGGAKVALITGATNPSVSTIIYCGATITVKPGHTIALLGFAGTRDMNYSDVVAFDRGLESKSLYSKHYLVEWSGKHEFPVATVFKDAFTFLNTGTVENFEKKKVTISPEKIALEQEYKKKYIAAFESQDLDWWKKEVASMNTKKKSDVMFERLLGFISLACYSMGNSELAENNLRGAEKIAGIYSLADPENKDCEAMVTEINRRKGLKNAMKF